MNSYSVKIAAKIFIISMVIIGIYYTHPILVPLLLAFLLAILLRPIVSFLNFKLKLPHVIAVFIATTLAIFAGIGIVFFISRQIAGFSDDIPNIERHLTMHYHNMQHWIYERFNISYIKQNNYIQKVTQEIQSGDGMIAKPLDHFSTVLITVVLIPVYTFFILVYRNLLINFLTKIVHVQHHPVLKEIILEVKVVIRRYIVGLLLEMIIVTTLVSTGLMLIGIDYAIFIGVVAGILNLIPYIGILTAALLSLSVALGSPSELSALLGILILFVFVHLIDSNILIPRVVSSKVKINALIAILGIVCGGSLIGIAGMFLALPVIAIMKVIFDRVPSLTSFGYLLGDTIPKTFDWYKLKLPDLNVGNEEEIISTPAIAKEGESYKEDC
jgi:predicted PurR-regulated permease PerM